MGYMSMQFLNRGRQTRTRGYRPTAVTVSCRASEWNGMKVKFSARKENGQYQTLLLSETEVNAALTLFIQHASVKTREKVLLTLMRELTHPKLLRALALDLRERVRLPPQH